MMKEKDKSIFFQDAHEFLVNVLNEVQEECDKLLRQWFTDVKEAERRKHNPVTSNFAFVLEADVTCEGFVFCPSQQGE